MACFFGVFFLEVCLFLASFPSCPGNSHQIEITGNRRSSLFITKEKGELWTQTQIDSWYPQGGSITLSEVEALNPSLRPPTHPTPAIKSLPASRLTTVFISSLHWALQNALSYLKVHSACLSDDYSICLFILLVTCQAHLEWDLGTGRLQGQVFNQRSHPSHSGIVLFFLVAPPHHLSNHHRPQQGETTKIAR